MDRFKKLLAAATLLVLPVIAACGEDVMPPPPTGSIVGQVSIEGMGVDGVTVSLSNGASTATAGGGNYRFDTVEQGSYTVTISGFPADASFDATSAPANIGDTGGTVTVDFRGSYIRTASIMGTVTVENMGLGGVTVKLSGMADSETTTDDSGQYSFTGLRSGTYSVEISGFDTNEVSFSSTSGAATVGVGESKVVSFDGTYLRTAGIQGQVSVDGNGLGGVTVTLMGQDAEETKVTDAGGLYAFSQLKSGDYTVAISGYDADDYEFETTSKSVTIATGETANVPFEGTLLRTAGIAGRVSVEGMGLDDVTVTLAGAAEATATTANGGQYSFAGLAAGTYVLTIANPSETAYNFAEDEMMKTVVLEDDQSAIVNFSGTHTRTASISGVLFIDEVMDDKERNDGEPSITEALGPWLASLADDNPAKAAVAGLLASAKVTLRGPDLNTETDIAIMPDGSFSTGESLMAGSYQVELPANDDDIAAGLDMAGVAFVGESMVVTVEAGGSATADFPFRITMQTLTTAAHMGVGDAIGAAVPGVKLALFARADMTGDPLDEKTTDEMGMATFNFARADNTGPAGNDDIVFVKVMESGHDALKVSGNEFVETVYERTERLSVADAKEVATLVNVAAAFDFWVKSNETARDGDMGLGGWQVQYCMPMAKTDDAGEVVCEGDKAAFKAIMMGEGDDAEPLTSDTTTATRGKASFAMTVDPMMLPAMFYVRATPVDVAEDGKRTSVQKPDMGEMWEQVAPDPHMHTGLELPPGDDDMPADLGPIRITFTTQSITVGVHRELDDRTGFTDYFGVDGEGDDRPGGTAAGKIEITLMEADDRGRLRVLTYDHDFNPKNDDIDATRMVTKSGVVSFTKIPANKKITVVVDEPDNMVIVPDDRATREIDAFGDQLDDFPDGTIVGAFGDMSGAGPMVSLCPLQRQEDKCSTFAYKWESGTISGPVTGLRKGDEDVMITLKPVNSNEDYAADLAKKTEVDYSATGTTYKFSGVADGRYEVTLEARAGNWRKDAKETFVLHDEGNSDDAYTGEVKDGITLSATDLRGVIRGVIGNNSNGRGGLTGSESRSGVVVNLHYAKFVGGTSAATKSKRRDGGAVKDKNGNPVTATTNDDGEFSFENLATDTVYLLKPQPTDLYTAVRNGNSKILNAKRDGGESADDVVPHALASAMVPDPDYTPGVPAWNYLTSKMTAGGSTDFVLLYKDGEAGGEATDPSGRAAHTRAVIELQRCLKVTDGTADDPANAATLGIQASACDEPADEDEREIPVGKDGSWEATGLMEGVYEVNIDLPSGYELVDVASDGTVTASTTINRFMVLKGSRADPERDVQKFNLRKFGAQTGTSITAVAADNQPCTAGNPTSSGTTVCVNSEDGTVDLTVTLATATDATSSENASIRISPSMDDSKADGSFLVTNKKVKKVSLKQGQLFSFFVHVTSESGYQTNTVTADDAYHIRRNADVRMDTLVVSYNDNNGAVRLTRDRRGLNLHPDGEVARNVGRTDMGKWVIDDAGDGTSALSLLLIARTIQPGYGSTVRILYSAGTSASGGAPAACGTGDISAGGTAELAADPTAATSPPAAQTRACIDIVDNNAAPDPSGVVIDGNSDNVRRYQILFERKRAPS